MKRILLFLLAFVFAVSTIGCTDAKIETSKNEVFTDDFFDGAEQMSLVALAGPLTGEQMTPVISLLKSLTLTPTDTRLSRGDENGDTGYGGTPMLVIKFEGAKVWTAFVSDEIITIDGGGSYEVEDENFYRGLLEAFGKT